MSRFAEYEPNYALCLQFIVKARLEQPKQPKNSAVHYTLIKEIVSVSQTNKNNLFLLMLMNLGLPFTMYLHIQFTF